MNSQLKVVRRLPHPKVTRIMNNFFHGGRRWRVYRQFTLQVNYTMVCNKYMVCLSAENWYYNSIWLWCNENLTLLGQNLKLRIQSKKYSNFFEFFRIIFRNSNFWSKIRTQTTYGTAKNVPYVGILSSNSKVT